MHRVADVRVRPGGFDLSASSKLEEHLVDLLARPLVHVPLRPDRGEAALLEDADRADVALHDIGVERPLGDLAQERREGAGRDAPPPEGAPLTPGLASGAAAR